MFSQKKSRILLEEEVVLQKQTPGEFSWDYELKTPLEVFGIWIQSDGDDTHSKFNVEIHEILLVSEARMPVPPQKDP